MKIYGVALLSACFLIGKLTGRFLGQLLNINSDVGGVGFAMFLLMTSSLYLRKKGWWGEESDSGIWFWSAMYIPIIVAMAASLNVKAAMTGGALGLLAGLCATIAGLLLVPIISKIGNHSKKNQDGDN